MKKILLHLSNDSEYRSFARALVKNTTDNFQVAGNVLHENLFDTHHRVNPNIVILPTNEYTQEFHDYITEYHKSIKIILFTNNVVMNSSIINFWNNTNTTIISKIDRYPEEKPNTLMQYISLYDDEVYKNLNRQRNDKIAVYLSPDDDKNHQLLDQILYPNSSNRLVLFNSTTFNHPQNIGLLTPEDSCRILNTYKSLIDIDDRFYLEANVCKIDNLSIDGNLITNIVNNIVRPIPADADNKSYNDFVNQSLLPVL